MTGMEMALAEQPQVAGLSADLGVAETIAAPEQDPSRLHMFGANAVTQPLMIAATTFGLRYSP